jgi:predicted dithiol-disulfide oxidoreductase (DUF899 family)
MVGKRIYYNNYPCNVPLCRREHATEKEAYNCYHRALLRSDEELLKRNENVYRDRLSGMPMAEVCKKYQLTVRKARNIFEEMIEFNYQRKKLVEEHLKRVTKERNESLMKRFNGVPRWN